MNKGYKVQIFPNEEQKLLMFKSFGCNRFAYNWALNRQQENYKNGGKFINDGDLRKEFTQLKKQEDFKWLNEVNNNVTKQAIKDLCKAYKKYTETKETVNNIQEVQNNVRLRRSYAFRNRSERGRIACIRRRNADEG